MENIFITDDKKEMLNIGKAIVEERSDIYTPLMLDKITERIKQEFPEETNEVIEEFLFCSIYDYWVYGNNIDEEFYYDFYKKNHKEKSEYLSERVRYLYVDYLNCGDVRIQAEIKDSKVNQLEMKYACYKLLEPYYKRDVIEIIDVNDYNIFEKFVSKHPIFVAKPSDYCFGIGVHKVNVDDYSSIKDCFEELIAEGKKLTDRHPSRKSSIVLEELIIQCQELSVFHPDSVNAIRITTVRDKDGNITIQHPWIKVGAGGSFVATAAQDGFIAEIDKETGVIITDGFSENGSACKIHPDTGITIKGYQIPKWNELLVFVDEIMKKVPTYGYIGWDLVLTDNGWVVMEANYAGECMWQLTQGKGTRKEFEELIGWKMDADFWWQIKPFVTIKN